MKRLIVFKYRFVVFLVELSTLSLIILLIYNFLSMPTDKKTFFLGSSQPENILKTLNDNGYKTYILDRLVLNMIQVPSEGWYTVGGEKMGRIMFFKMLHTMHAETMKVKLYGGETSEEMTQRLAHDMKLDAEKLLNIYRDLSFFKEANIIAGRYTLARDADEDATMHYLYAKSNDLVEEFAQKNSLDTPDFFELKVLFIIASIIQKESNSKKEMPLISSVIHNRLAKKMKLQMDGTLNYGVYAHTVITPERIKTDESPYNTYKYKGLPPEPLGAITLSALQAAYQPAVSDYLFFMLNKDGSHNFASTYKEHLANIRAFKSKDLNNRTKKPDTNSTHKKISSSV